MNFLKKLNDWYESRSCRFCVFFPIMLVAICFIDHDFRKLVGAPWLIWIGMPLLWFMIIWALYRVLIVHVKS